MAVGPIGDDLLGHVGWGEGDTTSHDWEDVDLDAEEMSVNAKRPWMEEPE